jgi:hypothetical protein
MENTPGPIARKLIAQIRGIKAQKVVDLQEWGEAKKRAAQLAQQNQPSAEALDQVGPEFELLTDVRQEAVCSSGYDGTKGELWLARVMPPPVGSPSRAVVVTTPYLVLNPGLDDWMAYLKRTLPKTQRSNTREAHEYLMKFGLQPNYWPEYVFESYVNHPSDVIYVRGLPDVPESRPHSRVNSLGPP